ncbi:ATP-binding protein [Portibacter marinus]|uniref:ATP-binding protein n=1 Tax=Portibacter marinus TaxID=2898660 RepID=UPI001F212D75|nr:ATP-binding protein [Portibacter marinus]
MRGTITKLFIATFFLIFWHDESAAQSDSVYVIDIQYPVHELNPHLKVFSDPERKYDEIQILTDTSLSSFNGTELKHGFGGEKFYWGKIRLRTSETLKGWTLHIRDTYIGGPAWNKGNGKVDFFAFVNGELAFHKKAGPGYKRNERDIATNWVLNRIKMDYFPVDQEVDLVVRAEGNDFGFPAFFRIDLRGPTQPYYHQIFQRNNTFNIFMFGVTFIILLYHILQYIYLKDKTFLFFSIWLLFCCATQFMGIGGLLDFFYPHASVTWMFIANGIYFVFWFFGRSFIRSKEKFPVIDRLMLGLSLLIIVEIIIVMLIAITTDIKPHLFGLGYHYHALAFLSFLGTLLSIYIAVQKDNLARYFGIGAIIGSSFFTVGSLWSAGIIARVWVDPYAWGILLQIVIFSFGIAFRRQILTKRANDEKLASEKKVAEMQRIHDLDEIKSKFFANISHEFRTPLTLIQGPLRQAKKTVVGNNKKYTLDEMSFSLLQRNTNRLQNLVDQLLDLSKLESGNVHLSLVKGGIIEFIKSLVFSFESMAERRSINFNTHFPSEIDEGFYDKDKLEKIVTNLLTNAIKYTPPNGTVTVSVDNNNDQLSFKVSDTGKGIKAEDQQKIFDRFFRVEGSEEKGSGIGLALTKELVELHNGRIHVNSTIGEGTTFKVHLPFLLKDLPENRNVFNMEDSRQGIIGDLSREEIVSTPEIAREDLIPDGTEKNVVLVVEDNEDLRTYIHSIVSKRYRTLLAKDGNQGERMAFEHIPDVIITDVMMPKKDGFALCNSLKNNQKTSHVPIIMLTAKAGFENKIEELSQGADAYLTKPFKEEELLIRIHNMVESRKKMWSQFRSLDLSLINDMSLQSIDDQFVQEVVHCIKENLDNEMLGVEDIARCVGFSRSQLHRKLKAITNKSANQLIVEIRMNEARRMLENKTGTVSEVAYSVGYSNLPYFTKSFKKLFGVLPSKVENR